MFARKLGNEKVILGNMQDSIKNSLQNTGSYFCILSAILTFSLTFSWILLFFYDGVTCKMLQDN